MALRVLAGTLILSFVVALQKPLEVKLSYLPQDSVIALANPVPPSILDRPAEIRIDDGRVQEDATVIGEVNDDNKLSPIKSAAEPLPYLRETLVKIAATHGLRNAPPGGRVLRLRIVRFWMNHSQKTVGAMYAAEVSIAFSLQDKAGTVLAEGAGSATATRYGKSRSADNCNEALSDALKEALFKVLDDQKLRDAWKIS